MSLTITNRLRVPLNPKVMEFCDLDFPAAYSFGGETITPIAETTLMYVENVIIPPVKGYSFEHDKANNKIKVFQQAPPIVYQERHVLTTDDQITLNYPCAFVLNIASATTHYAMIDYADTVAAGEVQYTALPTEGARSTLQFYSALTDELGGNGAFGADTNWSFDAGPWTVTEGGELLRDADGAAALTCTHDTFACVPGRTYRITYTLAKNGTDAITPCTISVGGVTGTAFSTAGTCTEDITAVTTGGLSIAATLNGRFSVDDLTVQDITVDVTYITQAWKEVWDNIVYEELETASHVAKSSYVYIAIESLYGTHATTAVSKFEYVRGGDAAGTGECEVDFTDSANSYLTTMTFASGDAITGTNVRAIKLPEAGFLRERFIEDEDCTMSSRAGASAYPILFHSTCGQLPDYTAANEGDPHNLQMNQKDGVGAAGECEINYNFRTTNAGTEINLYDESSDAVSLTYVWGVVPEIPGIQLLEVPDGTDLSSLTGVKAILIGV